nr:MAG TPA: hypothetical protein [Bacteriophage sp.]
MDRYQTVQMKTTIRPQLTILHRYLLMIVITLGEV